MDLRDALRTTAAARAFTDRPVDDALVAEILDDARFAPSGGNRQPWRVAVVRDPGVRRALADAMQSVWDEYVAIRATGLTPFAVAGPAPVLPDGPPPNAPNDLLEHIESVPAVLAVAADLRDIAMMDRDLDRPTLSGGASVYPFCWSILLAARARGLAGVLTTFAVRAEPVTGALLGLPADHALAATIFLGEPTTVITKLRREPVSAFATLERFDGPPLTGP